MRLLLDTNILIPLEDSQIPLRASLANFVRLANTNGHQLVYHPASEDDIRRDTDLIRRQQTLARLQQYIRIDDRLHCPWNDANTGPNDAADNEILYSLYCDAAHALVTEDRRIHDKARARDLGDRVFTIQTAEDWLRRLHEQIPVQLPNVEELSLYALTPHLGSPFFDSLREGYPDFDKWFREKARENRKAWVTWEDHGVLGAICIYTQQTNETITQDGLVLPGAALKLSTFKVGPTVRGRKIGELFLKAAFQYATANHLENIFIHGDLDQHHFLFELLEDFGFSQVGIHPGTNGRDVSYLKRHPIAPPKDDTSIPFEYLRSYFPHFRAEPGVGKYVVPIKPKYHRVLFQDYDSPADRQLSLFRPANTAGNAIKQAYLCHAQIKNINPGDIVLFYRSEDERAITSLGIVEDYQTLDDPSIIARRVSRRTVYSMDEIRRMAAKPTKVMLFRLVRHFENSLDHGWLQKSGIVNGNIQSIRSITHQAFERIIQHAGI